LRKNSDVYSLSGGDAAKCVSYSQLKTKFAGYKPYYMYRQKNTVGNLENVGFSIDGHEGLYNIYMMEEIQTIFAVGAGAVTKLVKHKPRNDKETETIIKRFFKPKYPYEYLRDATDTSEETKNKKEAKIREIMDFFSEN
jgi:oxygen-independent coproporphyrinogen-3 oxidase